MRAWLVLLLLVLFGCSAAKNTGDPAGGDAGGDSGGAGGAGGEAGGAAGGDTTGSGGQGGVGGFTGQGAGLPVGETEVFGHSPSTLYKLDPVTKEVTLVAEFDGCYGDGGLIDIALDKDGQMLGTTFDQMYEIDKKTGKCTLLAAGGFPNSLSFVPAGTLDPDVEALVGFEGSNYVRIDPATGQKTTIAQNVLGSYTSSGDVVSVIGGGTYVTVFGGPEGCLDCILEIDPKTGALVKNIGPLAFGSVYGLAFWGGRAYGFSGESLFEIDLATAATTLIDQPNIPDGVYYAGAGSATSAPLEPPQ